MNTNKLDKKALVAGILIILYGLLYFAVITLNYTANGMNLVQVLTSSPMLILYALIPTIAGVTLIVCNRIVAIVGLGIWAVYQAFSLISSILSILNIYANREPEIMSSVFSAQAPSWIASGCLFIGIVLVALTIALSGKGG